MTPSGVKGQFAVGVLLGAVWSPCVGPTLGAASVLAARDQDLVSVAAVMVAFGLGTSVPLLIVGLLSRTAMMRWRGKMMNAGKVGKLLLGGSAVTVAVLILTGADHALEAALVAASPAWLTDLTTRF
jgi:cytochrome c-type biogenesis protein